jgi:hypothetical protein
MVSLLNLLAYARRRGSVDHDCFEFLIKLQPHLVCSSVPPNSPALARGNALTILTQGTMANVQKHVCPVELKTIKLLLDSGVSPNEAGHSSQKTPIFYIVDQ